MDKTKGILLTVISSIAFGTMPLFAKLAAKGGLNYFTMLCFRFFVAAVALFIFIKIKGYDLKVNRSQFGILFFLGVIGSFGTAVFLFNSYNYISTGLSTILHFIYPVAVTILSIIIYKEKINKDKAIALILSIAGIYFLVGKNDASVNVKGVILALISGLFYSLYIIVAANKKIKSLNSFTVIFYVTLMASLGAFVFSGVTGNFHFVLNLNTIIGILGLSVVCTVLSLMLFFKGIKIIGPSNASILSTLEPIVSIILGAILLNEKVNFMMVIGSILVILSVITVTLSEKKKESAEN